jgi:hypothetical protein
LVGKCEEKRELGRQGLYVRIILEWVIETGWQDVDRVYLPQDREER